MRLEHENPLVSVVIPCYNHAQFVQETIQSVIDQDYENIELIIIDDGSKDNSVEVIQKMIPACEERFVKFEFRYRPNKGLCATLNEALKWCEGDFFAPVASDDILLNFKTRVQIEEYKKINSNKIAGVFGAVSTFKSNNKRNVRKLSYCTSTYIFNDVILRKAKLPAPSAMLVTNKVKSVNGYNPSVKIEDFYLWLKLTEHGDSLLYINKVLSLYRRHPNNTSQNDSVMLDGVMQILDGYSDFSIYNEAKSRSYLVHAGDLIQSRRFSAFRYLVMGLKITPKLIFNKLMLAFFYRGVLGALGK